MTLRLTRRWYWVSEKAYWAHLKNARVPMVLHEDEQCITDRCHGIALSVERSRCKGNVRLCKRCRGMK